MKFLPAQFSLYLMQMFQNNFIHSNIFQSEQIQRSYHEKSLTHYACRNADLNLRPVAAKTSDSFFK